MNKFKFSTQINSVGFILIIIAGWVDTVGINLFLKENSAFMTGRGRILGYSVFKGDMKIFMGVILIVLSFIFGSFISTIITKKYGLTGGLLFTATLIILVSVSILFSKNNISTIFIPMAMGCQNAATSLTAIDRTTHLTGAATDIGINIADRNWNVVGFWVLRWIGFPIGVAIGFNLVHMVHVGIISMSIALFVPGIIIILIAIIQKKFFNIPLLDEIIIDIKDMELHEMELKDKI